MVTLTGERRLRERGRGLQYTLDGSGTRSYTGPFPVPMDGPHTITFRSVDMTGLVETTKTFSFTNDATRAVLEGDAQPGRGERATTGPDDRDPLGERLRRRIRASPRSSTCSTAAAGRRTRAPFVVSRRRLAHDPVPRDRQRGERGGREVEVVHDRRDRSGHLDHDAVAGREHRAQLLGHPGVLVHRHRLGRVVVLGRRRSSRPARSARTPYTVTATDNAGNTTTLTHTYNVVWPFTWVSPPSSEKAGKSVAVKFRLGGNYGLGVLQRALRRPSRSTARPARRSARPRTRAARSATRAARTRTRGARPRPGRTPAGR